MVPCLGWRNTMGYLDAKHIIGAHHSPRSVFSIATPSWRNIGFYSNETGWKVPGNTVNIRVNYQNHSKSRMIQDGDTMKYFNEILSQYVTSSKFWKLLHSPSCSCRLVKASVHFLDREEHNGDRQENRADASAIPRARSLSLDSLAIRSYSYITWFNDLVFLSSAQLMAG